MHGFTNVKTSSLGINLTLSVFALPLCQWKSNKYYMFWVCVCNFRYTACNAHAPYFHLWPARLYIIFPHYLTNGGGELELLNIKCVFWLSLQLLSEPFLVLRGTEEYTIVNVERSAGKVPTCYYCQILMKVEFSRHIFEKSCSIKISLKSIQWEPNCSIRTDRHDEVNIRFSQFFWLAGKPHFVHNIIMSSRVSQNRHSFPQTL